MTAMLYSVKENGEPTPYFTGISKIKDELHKILANKYELIETALCAVISSGHLLLEDVPGVGKTTFIKALARLLNLDVVRVQFTSDLLPTDITGVEVFNSAINAFELHKGPIFSNIILADELNRASPRTQSSLLEAMGEGSVTIDRKTYQLPKPFFVFASQNPAESLGTYPLPDSQLDRFSAKINLGYPEEKKEIDILQKSQTDPLLGMPESVLTRNDLQLLQTDLEKIYISEKVAQYTRRFLDESRKHEELRLGISTRGGVIWHRMAKAKALLAGREYVIPDDLQKLALPCLAHRIVVRSGVNAEQVIQHLLKKADI